MKFILQIAFFAVLLSSATSCLIKPPEPDPVLWMKAVDFTANTPIRNMHASPLELYIISDDEFIRLGPESVLKERRVIPVPFEFFGRPILSDYTFARLVRTQPQGGALLELNLALAPGNVLQVPFDSFRADASEVLIPVAGSSTEYPAAFNDDGTQLLLPMVNFSGNSHTFFLLNIQLDFTKTKFTSVDVLHRIDIPELPSSTDRLTNVCYHEGNFYIVTKDGAFQIRPDGTYQKIIPTWLYDFFTVRDTLFASGRGLDLHFSTDNGRSWAQRDSSSEVRLAEVIGDKVFSQMFTGDLYQMADPALRKVKPVVMNDGFPEIPTDAYSNLLYFYDGYYLVVQKEIYISCGISTVDE